MNKLTTLLAGVALAAVVAAPASAQNAFANIAGSPTPLFAFGPGNSTYTLNGASVQYLVNGVADSTGTLSLSGSGLIAGSTYNYTNTDLVYTPTTGSGFTESGPTNVTLFGNTVTFSALGGGFSGSGHSGDRLNLSYATAPVPEAGTVVSFGALLALGGLAVLRRKSVARAS